MTGAVPEQIPVTAAPQVVEDNPKIPVKAIIAAVTAIALYLTDLGIDLPPWLMILLGAVVVGGGTFLGKNPKQVKPQHKRDRRRR
jgi:hypothetical protein